MVYDYWSADRTNSSVRIFATLRLEGLRPAKDIEARYIEVLRDADIEAISSFHRQENLMWQFLLITDGLSVSIIKHSLII